jgi:peroxiredoxin
MLQAADRPPDSAKAAARVDGFTLKDTNGKAVSLADFRDKQAVVVVFIGVECPLANQYVRRLHELHEEFSDKGVQFIAINSNSQDSAAAVADHAKKNQLPFPVLKDDEQKVADLFHALRTPEAFLLDPSGTIRYHGRIDDQYGIGVQRLKATSRDLADAITALLDGKPIANPVVDVSGCYIGRDKPVKAATGITYTKDVAPIVQKHCQECHRPGQIGPMSLMTYEKARSWSDTIRDVVSERRMPPWLADPRYGHFANDRSMPAKESETLLAWIDQGCPKGDDKDLPPPRTFTGADGWSIGKPDVIISMKEPFSVPAKAPIFGLQYQYFKVKTDFPEDLWVQAAECRPGNRAVVHHIIVYVLEGGKRLNMRNADAIGSNLLAATAPGDLPTVLPPGVGKRIPKGATLLFQLHYTPNGVEATDQSSIGLILCKAPPQHIGRTRSIFNQRFTIPANDGNYAVDSTSLFDRDAILIGYMPHMHLRGKDFQYEVVYPDAKKEILLSVPRYDFSWQTGYRLAKPLQLPAGTRINCYAHFDNSTNNPNNPSPTTSVTWGDMTWQEMMIGWVDYYYLKEPEEKADAK